MLRSDRSVVFARWRQCTPYLIHGSLSQRLPAAKRHLDRLSRFRTARGREGTDRHTHTHTHTDTLLRLS